MITAPVTPTMSKSEPLFEHAGRASTMTVSGHNHDLQALQRLLVQQEFVLERSTDDSLEFSRKLRLLHGDWPMRLSVRKQPDQVDISCYMFIPWTWIVAFALMALLFVPVLTFRGAPLAYPLALLVTTLAIYKQKFDLRPNAFWQGPPRDKWRGIVRRLTMEAFGDGPQT